MAVNRGKQFEEVIKKSFLEVDGVSIDRLYDQTNGYVGSSNICDFIVYKKPYEYYIECKSVHGNTLSIHSIPKPDKHGVLHGFYGNITDTQWEGLLEKSKIPGVYAGIICWWIDKDVTAFIPIWYLDWIKRNHPEVRSINVNSMLKESKELEKYIDFKNPHFIQIKGKKKRVFFDYSMQDFFTNFE